MKYVHPSVRLIGETMPDKHAIAMYLRECGYDDTTVMRWDNLHNPTLNDLIEFMGRLCYASFDTSRNENLTRVRSDQAKYLWNILESGHGSVLEHANVNFVIRNCSRVVTHELVRHRVGVAISQESMRYVRLDDWDFVYPEAFNDPDLTPALKAELLKEATEINAYLRSHINYMTELLHVDDMNFDKKKRFTSALRKFIPHGVATQIGWSANIRTLRHVISMRTDDAAEEEMRAVADGIARICFDKYPLLFADFEYSGPTNVLDAPVWKPKFK